jgi:GntR family transcriptional repressor for pyruvate dehydrogenase complex
MFNKIKPKKVSDEIYEQLRTLILKGELTPGTKLPPERELATKMGVSRPSIREAFHKLEVQGFIEQIQGDGTYIRPFTQEYLDTAIDEFMKNKSAIFDLMEVRKTLETWSAATAALRATDEQIAEMETYLNELKIAKDKGEIGHIADIKFHYAITSATSNVLQMHLMKNIHDWIEKVSYEVRSNMYKSKESQEILYKQHYDIFNAIKNKKPELAHKTMKKHIEHVEEHLRKIHNENN